MVERNASRVQIKPNAKRQEGAQLNPGDQAGPGTPGTGENICPQCQGRGRLEEGRPCPDCGGSGKIIEGIGGG
ncbi:MAG TPA: hypothetical protein VF194_01630 [Ferrovibrio sp.]|uniref:hypothetical protein n=1 Tax=Ferrovibrio sp. TaxID=1917215 RepID=UPI002ED5B958